MTKYKELVLREPRSVRRCESSYQEFKFILKALRGKQKVVRLVTMVTIPGCYAVQPINTIVISNAAVIERLQRDIIKITQMKASIDIKR